jgi:aspartyl-tRNA(Asn)/glutamyl-tRNA(Gln) amidotransferase subunit A
MTLLTNNGELTIARVGRLIRNREISPVEVTEYLLERIRRFQPMLNAFITITGDLALKQAQRAEREIVRGHYRGPLHGIPISLKDLFYTKGIRTTGGSKILRRFVPNENAAVVDRLLQAGVVIVGKTNLHEFAFGVTNVNPHYGPVHNPWDMQRISGGSSGGSAASVISALALASLGTDTGGSIRIPAAACGCVGLKPTYGRIALNGVIPLADSLDHVGPLTRCVHDAGIMLEAISKPNQNDSGSPAGSDTVFTGGLRKGVKGLRIGVPRQYFFNRVQTAVRRNFVAALAALERIGARICEVDLKGMDETDELAAVITCGEALANHWDWIRKRPSDYGEDVRLLLEGGMNQLSSNYLLAQKRRRKYGERLADALRSVEVLAMPAIPVVAPRIEENQVVVGRNRENVRSALLRLTRPGNLSGLPAISVPCGFSDEGLPTGLQLMGRHWEEAMLLRVAYAFEQATSWHRSFPIESPGQM